MIKDDHTKCLLSSAQAQTRHVLNVLEFSGAAPKYLTESRRTKGNCLELLPRENCRDVQENVIASVMLSISDQFSKRGV